MLQARLPHGEVVLPERRPIIGVKRVEARVARNHRAQIRPRFRRLDQSRAERIQQHVIRASHAEGLPLPLPGGEHMIMRLMLELRRLEERAELRPEELHRVALILKTALAINRKERKEHIERNL